MNWNAANPATARTGDSTHAAAARNGAESAIAIAGIPFRAQVALTPRRSRRSESTPPPSTPTSPAPTGAIPTHPISWRVYPRAWIRYVGSQAITMASA